MCNGVLAGLVSITAGCATCPAWAAILIGMGGGCIYRLASYITVERLGIDDPLDAFAVHGASGAWGITACAIFSADYYTAAVSRHTDGGLLYGSPRMLGAALLFLVTAIAWVGTWCAPPQ